VAGTTEIVFVLASDEGSAGAFARELFLTEDESEVFLARGISKTNSLLLYTDSALARGGIKELKQSKPVNNYKPFVRIFVSAKRKRWHLN